jgi:hypothetical protein
MGIAAGPYNSRDGLVLWYDIGNTKSFRGEPVTNFFTNGHFSGGSGIPGENGSNATNDIIVFPNPGDSQWVLRQTGPGQFTEYQINLTSQLTASTTYVMSGWYAESSDYQGADGSRMFHSAAYSSTGAHQATGIGIGTVITTTVIGGIVWKYCYQTITTPSNYSNQFNWYLGYGNATFSGNRYYTNIQMEVGTYPKSFSNGTRGTTVATGGGIIDLSGKSNNAELVNGPTYSSSLGGLVSFDGTNDHLLLPNGVLSGTGDFTIIQFLRGGGASIGTTFANYPSGNLQIFFGTNYIGMWLGNSSTYLGVSPWNTQLPQYTTAPVMIAAVRSGTTTQFWINDKIEKTGTSSFSIGTTSSQFRIGTNTSGGEAFSGSIFNTQVYNRALSSAEVIQTYNSLRTRFITRSSIVTNGLVLHLDAGNPTSFRRTGTTWSDLSGYSNNGTLTNGPSFQGSHGGSFKFDGVNDSVITSLTGVITTMTVECWFRGTSTARNHLWNFGNYGDNSNLNFNFNDSGYDLWVYWESGGTNRVRYNIDGSFTDGAIKHVVFTHTGSTNKVYLNGTELTITESGGTQTFTSVNLSGYFAIGNVVAFAGNVYSARVYNRALSASEVLQNFNATKSRFGL